jgi:transposase InsO family protein
MPWRETCAVDQRVALLADWLREEWTMTELAARYAISRKTAYKWIGRYAADGAQGLIERSRAPHHAGHAMAPAVRTAILAIRRTYPHWGPRKLAVLLHERTPTTAWPAPSTIGELLRREGLSTPRRRHRYIVPLTQPLAAAQQPNDVWTADFKGWFRTGDGTRCDPLTVADACSRFVLCCRIVPPTRAWFERTFRTYGLPRALRTDNGAPIASTGPGRLSRLAVWWLKLGIQLDRIDPGHPEQNGRHERFHLTLQREATSPPATSPAQQQRRFDRQRHTFNDLRPHEALAQTPPARTYQASPRPYPPRLEDPWYDATYQVRRVHAKGHIKWRGDLVFLSEAVIGELVGLVETPRGDWTVRFMHVELGRIDRQTRTFAAAWHGRRLG